MAHLLCGAYYQGIVTRISSEEVGADGPEIGIESRYGRGIWICGIWKGPDITLRCQGRKHHVGIIHSKLLMPTPRAHITSNNGQAWSQLTLDGQIPLHHIIAMGMGLDISGTERIRQQL